MALEPLICGPVRVTWKSADTIEEITYDGRPLKEVINETVSQIGIRSNQLFVPHQLFDVINYLLDSIAALDATKIVQKIYLATRIFEHLRIHPIVPNPKLSGVFWRMILDNVWKWEDCHEKVHKGTAYYWMAETFLDSGDVASAYISFFNALEDDKIIYPIVGRNFKEAPAYLTTSLVDNTRNALYPSVVVPLRTRMQSFIYRYNSQTGRSFSMPVLDKKFLQNDDFEEIKRFFVANFHEIYHLNALHSTRMINNDYSKLKVIDTLFNVSLVIDQILAHKFLQRVPKNERNIANAFYKLALQLGWTTAKENKDAGRLLKKISPNLNSGPPDNILPAILDGKSTYKGASMNYEMRTVCAAYHLRNYGGHHLQGSTILIQRHDEILDMVMGAFFLSVETL